MLEEFKENILPLEAMIERNLKGKYKNSAIGLAWGIFTPILLTFVIWLVFTHIKGSLVNENPNYWFYLASGIFSLTIFANCIKGRAFYNNGSYIKKTSIPKWVPVFAEVISQFIILAITYTILIIAGFVQGITISPTALPFMFISILIMFVMSIGCTFFFSTLNLLSNDMGHIMSVISRVLIWITPVFFFMNDSRTALRIVASYNPFTYFIESIHQILYEARVPDFEIFGVATLLALATLSSGWSIFKYYENELAERL